MTLVKKLSSLVFVVVACGESVSPYYAGGDFTVQITSSGLEREFLVHVPLGLAPGEPAPVLLVLHGAGGNGRGMQRYTELDEPADRAKFLVVYPDAVDNGTSGWAVGGETPSDLAGIDDPTFISEVLDFLDAELNIDLGRVYLVGLSNGALFSQRLACTMENRFAGMASVAMTMIDSVLARCDLGSGMPAMFFIGTDDPFWHGRVRAWYTLISAESMVNAWAELNGCEAHADVTALPDVVENDSSTVERWHFDECPGSGDVLFYAVQGGGHNWPGSPFDVPLLGCTNRDVEASQLIVDFFLGGADAALSTPPALPADSGEACDRLIG